MADITKTFTVLSSMEYFFTKYAKDKTEIPIKPEPFLTDVARMLVQTQGDMPYSRFFGASTGTANQSSQSVNRFDASSVLPQNLDLWESPRFPRILVNPTSVDFDPDELKLNFDYLILDS